MNLEKQGVKLDQYLLIYYIYLLTYIFRKYIMKR